MLRESFMIPSPKSTSNNLFCSFCEMNARDDTVSVALITEEKSKMSFIVKAPPKR